VSPTDAVATAGPDPAARREYRTVLLLLAIGAVLLFVGYAQTWAFAVSGDAGMPSVEVALRGRDLQPAASASAILALAGIAGLVATRRTGRIVTGVLLAFEGLLAAGGALAFGLASGERADVLALVADRVGVDGDAEVTITAWWLAVAVGGVLLVVVGVLAAVRGGRWPVMSGRYDRSQADDAAAAPEVQPGAAGAWDALDQGIDPTLDRDAAAPSGDHAAPPEAGTGTMTPTDAQEDPR
jgi:uncharacterized membrane protein (TIGR02234 family)